MLDKKKGSRLIKEDVLSMTMEKSIAKQTDTNKTPEQRYNEAVSEFNKAFAEGTSNPDSFISIGALERLWSELEAKTSRINADHVKRSLASVDEGKFISKKKRNTKKEKG